MTENWERRILDWFAQRRKRIEQEEAEAAEMLEELKRRGHTSRLSKIKVVFNHHNPKGERAMAPVEGPAILIAAGQVAIASVLGFDQNDNPMPADFVMPPVTFTIDDPSVATLIEDSDGETALVTAVADGVANVKASLETAEGLALSDTEQVTVDLTPPPPPPPPPTPVLTSIQVAFDVQAPPAAAAEGEQAAPEASTTAAAPASSLSPNQKLAAAATKTT